MKFKEYLIEMDLIEMAGEIDVGGYSISHRTMKKMKKKYKTEDEFMSHLKAKVKHMDSSDEFRIRAAYKEI